MIFSKKILFQKTNFLFFKCICGLCISSPVSKIIAQEDCENNENLRFTNYGLSSQLRFHPGEKILPKFGEIFQIFFFISEKKLNYHIGIIGKAKNCFCNSLLSLFSGENFTVFFKSSPPSLSQYLSVVYTPLNTKPLRFYHVPPPFPLITHEPPPFPSGSSIPPSPLFPCVQSLLFEAEQGFTDIQKCCVFLGFLYFPWTQCLVNILVISIRP